MYGNQTAPLDVAEARRLWQEIRTWATDLISTTAELGRAVGHGERGVALDTLPCPLDSETVAFLEATMAALRCEPEIYALILFG